jgi:hypothetical protein
MKFLLLAILIIFLTIPSTKTQNNPICKGKRYMCDNNHTIINNVTKATPAATTTTNSTNSTSSNSTNSTNATANTTAVVVANNPFYCGRSNDTKDKLTVYLVCPTQNTQTYCNWTSTTFGSMAKCLDIPPANLILPGEPCTKNAECQSTTCVNDICIGRQLGQSCDNDTDCDVGLFCSSIGFCIPQQQVGQNCSRDVECSNNCACSLGTCVYYYSFDNFLPANNSVVCASGYVFNGTCFPGIVSQIKGRPCAADSDCMGWNYTGGLIQYGQCQCGYNGGITT